MSNDGKSKTYKVYSALLKYGHFGSGNYVEKRVILYAENLIEAWKKATLLPGVKTQTPTCVLEIHEEEDMKYINMKEKVNCKHIKYVNATLLLENNSLKVDRNIDYCIKNNGLPCKVVIAEISCVEDCPLLKKKKDEQKK